MVAMLAVIILAVYNQKLIYYTVGYQNQKDSCNFGVVKRVDHDKNTLFLEISADNLQRHNLSKQDIENEKNKHKKRFLESLLKESQNINLSMYIHLREQLLRVTDISSKRSWVKPLKPIGVTKFKNINIKEILEDYVYWEKEMVEHTLDDFLTDMSVLIAHKNIYASFSSYTSGITILHTEFTTKIYKASLLEYFLNCKEKELKEYFGKEHASVGNIYGHKFEFIVKETHFVLVFPREFKANYKRRDEMLTHKKETDIKRLILKDVFKEEEKKQMLEYIDNFKYSAFLENLKVLNFVKVQVIKVSAMFLASSASFSRFSSYFTYEIPNNDIATYADVVK